LSSCQGISGFQFHVDGVDLISASDHLDQVSSANNNVLAFSFTGAQLDPGSGNLASLLFYAEVDGATIDLSNVVIGSSGGEEIAVSGPDAAAIATCTNFDSDDLCDIDVDSDDDNDCLPDTWELEYGLNIRDASSADSDLDQDGLIALLEYQNSTDPTDPDSDQDGVNDGVEVLVDNSNPNLNIPVLITIINSMLLIVISTGIFRLGFELSTNTSTPSFTPS
jgi:hypothetical protein